LSEENRKEEQLHAATDNGPIGAPETGSDAPSEHAQEQDNQAAQSDKAKIDNRARLR